MSNLEIMGVALVASGLYIMYLHAVISKWKRYSRLTQAYMSMLLAELAHGDEDDKADTE